MSKQSLPHAEACINSEDRVQPICRFYGISRTTADALIAMGKDQRKQPCLAAGISPSIVRTMADYDRYSQAKDIHEIFSRLGQPIDGLRVLDFGCLVADYAIYFARLGADVTVYDGAEEVAFACQRLADEQLEARHHILPTACDILMQGQDLVVFGEVLEHIEDPRVPLQACVDANVRFLFTSCYPYGDDEYFQLSGHLKSAQQLQPHCISILEGAYGAIPSSDNSVLWHRRDLLG